MIGFRCLLLRYVLLVLTFCITLSKGKHFRGGTVSWHPTKNYDDLIPEISFVFRLGWQYSFFHGKSPNITTHWRCTQGCSIVFVQDFQLMTNDSQSDWLWGGNNFAVQMYQKTSNFALQYSALGMESNMILPGNRLWEVEVGGKTGIRSDTNLPNSSPVTNMLPVITINNANTTIKIPVTDIDQDVIKCFFKNESTELRNIITLDQDGCMLTFVRRETPLEGYLAIDLVIKDFPKTTINLHGLKHITTDYMSFIPLQFFIHFVNVATPSYTARFTPRSYLKPMYTAKVNSKVKIGPIAVNMSTGKPDLLILGPTGMIEKINRRLKNGMYNKTVKWTPKPNQIGLHVICVAVVKLNALLHVRGNFLCTNLLVKDVCFPNPCQNGGHCVPTKTRFRCECPISFTGKRCQKETVECEKDSCWNSGWCDLGATSPGCVCVTGFQGLHCYNDNDECASGACAENAICTNTVGSFTCTCKHGFKGEPLQHCTGYCEEETITTANGTFTFPSSWVKLPALSKQVCPDSNRSMATIRCVQYTQKDGQTNFKFDPKSFHHLSCDVTIEGLENELHSNTTSKTVEKVVKNLDILTSAGTNRSDHKKATNMLQRISKLSVSTNIEVLITFANVASNIIDKLPERSSAKQSKAAANHETSFSDRATWIQKNTLITSVLNIGRTTELARKTTSILVDTARISVEILDLEQIDKIDASQHDENATANNSITISPKVYTDAANGIQTNPVSLTIPKSVYRQKRQVTCDESQLCVHESATRGVRASLVVDKSALKVQHSSTGEKLNEEKTQVVAIELSSIDTSSLPDPITLTFRKTKRDNRTSKDEPKFRCVFWDEYNLAWSSRGCVLRSSDENVTKCECNHMTTFALLVNIADNAPNEKILGIVSNIGCILSSVCLVLTIIIHLSISQLRNRRPTPIMVNLCSNLLITYLLFFFGIERSETKIVCHMISVTLHWSLLSAWCWMAVYNYSMYLAFVKVFDYVRKHFWLTVSLFAYGLPTLIVAVSVGYFMFHIDQNSAEETETSYRMIDMCWLRGDALYYTFLVPVGILLFYNLVVYFLVLRKITWKRTEIQSTIKKTSMTHELVLGISLAACLGLPWIFGYFMLISTDYYFHMIMSWLFTGFNAFQGFSIFIISCVRQHHVRKLWVRYLMRSKIYRNITHKTPEQGTPNMSSKASPTISSRLTTRRNFK